MNRRDMLCLLVSSLMSPLALSSESETAETVNWLEPGPKVPDVTLKDHLGRDHHLVELCNRPVVVSFFYTGCAAICPPQTAMLRNLNRLLNEQAGSAYDENAPLLLSITLSPFSDSPQALQSYAERFEVSLGEREGWLMLTGNPDALAQVWRAFDAPVVQPEEHTALLWLGSGAEHRWTRVSALTDPQQLFRLIKRQL